MIILHEYRTGKEFAIWPADVRAMEQLVNHTLVVHTMPFQDSEKLVNTPAGPQKIQPPVQVLLNYSEVFETVQSIQRMIIETRCSERYGTDPNQSIIDAAAAGAAEIVRAAVTNANFGNGPRVEVVNG